MSLRRPRFNRSTTTGSMASALFNAKDVNSMHQSLNSEFMLYQLILKRILTGNNKDSTTENGLLEYFKPEDDVDKDTFKEFDSTYKPKAAIYWYTRETCIYRMLNQALRTHNIKHLLGFSSFIRDLNVQLAQEQKGFLKKFRVPVFQVYRGQYISKDEVNRIKSGIGQLIAMNSFLSTSTNFKKALEFATARPPSSDTLTSILLEIDVSVSALTRPFADIKQLSAFPSEEEILFMFGNIFRIDNVWEDKKQNIWRAKFTLCNDTDEDYRAFMATLEKDLDKKDQLVSLGHYMLEMGNFDEAEQHYRTLLESKLVNNDYDLATCHHELARVYTKKGDYDVALDNIDTALKYLSKENTKRKNALIALCYNDYGSIYGKKGDCIKAFTYYEKALRIKEDDKAMSYAGLSEIHVKMGDYHQALVLQYKRLEELPETAHCLIAGTYIEIGKIYSYMNEREQSSNMFQDAIKIQMKALHAGHPDLGYSYTGIALMYSEIGDDAKALEYLNKALELQFKSLPNNHPDFCETYKNFGNLYLKKKDFDKALLYYKKLLDCQITTLSPTHPSVSDTEVLIGKVYFEKGDFKQSLVYYKQSLDNQLERKPFGDSSLSSMYQQIAEINVKADDLDEALEYNLKILDNDLERKVLEDQSFADTYKVIGDIYCKKGDFHQGLFYYYRLLDCQLQTRPFKDSAVIDTYALIGKIYLEKPCDQTLLNFNESISEHIKKDSSASTLLLDTHMFVGNIHFEKRHLDQAFIYFKHMYASQLKKVAHDHESLIETLKILGNIATDKNQFDEASVYMNQLLKIELKTKSFDDESLINIYKTMGKVYFEKYNFENAIAYYNRLLDAQLRVEPVDDAAVNETFIKVGKIYLIRPFSNKFTLLNKLLGNEITDKSFADISEIMGDEHFQQRNLDRTFEYFEKLIDDQKNTSLPKTIQPVNIYKILGNISIEKYDWSLALFYYNRLLKETSDENEPLVAIYKTIGTIHYERNELDQALVYYKKALDNELVRKTIEDPSLAETFKIMGTIFYKMYNLQQALVHFNRLLDCQLHTKPFEESAMIETYKMIAKIYEKKPYDETLLYYNQDSYQETRVSSSITTRLLKDYIIINNKHLETRRLDEALKYFQRRQKHLSNSSSLFKNNKILANIYLEKNDIDQALKYLHKVLASTLKKTSADDPSHRTIYKMIANIYCKKQDPDQALHYANLWLDCLFKLNKPNDPSVSEAYVMLGEIFLIQQTFDHTMHVISKLYENNPGGKLSTSDLNNLVQQLHSERRHLDGAIEFFQKLLFDQRQVLSKQDPSLIRIFTILKNMYLYHRALKHGLTFFQQLLRDPKHNLISASIYEIIGYFNAELGNTYEALTNYRRSLAIYERILPPTNSLIAKLKREVSNMLRH